MAGNLVKDPKKKKKKMLIFCLKTRSRLGNGQLVRRRRTIDAQVDQFR